MQGVGIIVPGLRDNYISSIVAIFKLCSVLFCLYRLFLTGTNVYKSAPKLWLGSIVCDRDLLNGWVDYKKILGVAFYVPPTLPAIPITAPHTLSHTVNVVNKWSST